MTDEAKPGYAHERWAKHFEEIDAEISRLAMICKIPLLDPGVIERVLKNDGTVCGASKPRVFEKLRALLMMHYSVLDRALVALGEAEALAIVGEIAERLRARAGDRLGGPTA